MTDEVKPVERDKKGQPTTQKRYGVRKNRRGAIETVTYCYNRGGRVRMSKKERLRARKETANES